MGVRCFIFSLSPSLSLPLHLHLHLPIFLSISLALSLSLFPLSLSSLCVDISQSLTFPLTLSPPPNSCSEDLLSLRPYVLFATHFPELLDLCHVHSNIDSLSLSVTFDPRGGIKYHYRVQDLSLSEEQNWLSQHYGLRVAAQCSLPVSVMEYAREVRERVSQRERERDEASLSKNTSTALYHQALRSLLALKHSSLSVSELTT